MRSGSWQVFWQHLCLWKSWPGVGELWLFMAKQSLQCSALLFICSPGTPRGYVSSGLHEPWSWALGMLWVAFWWGWLLVLNSFSFFNLWFINHAFDFLFFVPGTVPIPPQLNYKVHSCGSDRHCVHGSYNLSCVVHREPRTCSAQCNLPRRHFWEIMVLVRTYYDATCKGWPYHTFWGGKNSNSWQRRKKNKQMLDFWLKLNLRWASP